MGMNIDWNNIDETTGSANWYVPPGQYQAELELVQPSPWNTDDQPQIELRFSVKEPNATISDVIRLYKKSLPIAATKLRQIGCDLTSFTEDTFLEEIITAIKKAGLNKTYTIKVSDYIKQDGTPRSSIDEIISA